MLEEACRTGSQRLADPSIIPGTPYQSSLLQIRYYIREYLSEEVGRFAISVDKQSAAN
jgi:hypothetical protein